MTSIFDDLAQVRDQLTDTYLAGVPATDRLRLERTDLLYAWDVHGQRYLDYTSGGGVLPLGWHHRINEAIREYFHQSPPTGATHFAPWGESLSFVQVDYAKAISERFPLVDGEPMQVLMTSSGQEARDLVTEMFPASPYTSSVYGIEPLNPDCCEPNTTLVPPDDAVIVMDERFTGFGRTGTFCAREQMPRLKDVDSSRLVTVLGDSGGSGIPWGAVVAGRQHFADLPARRRMGGNPLACAAGLAMLGLMDGPFLEHAHDMAHDLDLALQNLKSRFPVIIDVVGKGLARGIVFSDQQSSRAVHREALKQGLILGQSPAYKTLTMTPPLIITEFSLREGFDKMTAAMVEAQAVGFL